ncbi:GNAT family N-acetyltransferase [Hominenteromicrobium sp.]|uniref:GNAT family N-acetyltransferase n=1 Tax=Hominenteromicrobium sp. TaxID=3073581 RepID=UPI003A8E9FD6
MIRLAENLEALSMPCVSSPFGCQIRSKAQAYGFHQSFAQFWTDGEAAYGKTDGSVCIAGEITDADEARAFLRAVGTNEVVCSAENAEKLGLNITESGAILQKVLRNETVHPAGEISPREIYAVLNANGMVGEFEPFYLDLSHRMRHGTVRCAGASADGKTVAVAAAVLGESASLISAVAVLPKFHRRGLGTAVVRKMERMLPSGTVYILREESKNEAFYDALGYKPCGAWAQGKLCN